MTSPIDVEPDKIPDGYVCVREDLWHDILNVFAPVHACAVLTEEVLATVRAGQPHSSAVVSRKQGGLVLVDGKGGNQRPQVELVGIACAIGPMHAMYEAYSGLASDEEFVQHLIDAGLATNEEDDGSEE